MAAYIQVSQLLFIGASTDTKPANNVTPVGAQCLEYTAATSTSKFYMNDGTAWRDLSDPYLAAIKAKTDNLPASPAAVGSAMTLTAAYDAAKTAAADTEVAKIPKSDGAASWNATAIAALQAAAQAAITASALGTAAELAKVPKSDAAVTFNATALGSINAEVDTALNTIVPASPTAGSLNDALSKAAGGNTFNKAIDSFEAIRYAMDELGSDEAVLCQSLNTTTTTKNATIVLFALNALAGPIKDIKARFYLAADAAATFTPQWFVTRAGDAVTFTVRHPAAVSTIPLPAVAGVYEYDFGDLAEGNRLEFRVAQDNFGNATNVIDGVLTYVR